MTMPEFSRTVRARPAPPEHLAIEADAAEMPRDYRRALVEQAARQAAELAAADALAAGTLGAIGETSATPVAA